MKILVSIKRVVDYNVKVQIKSDHTGVETQNLKMSMNPFDEIAVEEALRTKEAGKASEVVLASIGPAKAQETLRTGLAMGADRALLVETETPVEPLVVAKLLKQLVLRESPDLVILGKQAIDDDSNQTAQMLAGLLDWPQGTFASELSFNESGLEVKREVDGGLETLALSLPAVISTDLRLNEPRYIKLPNIMKAKRKPLDVIPVDTLDVDLTSRLTLVEVNDPEPRSGGIRVETVSDLLNKLRSEAKVI
jgi:electron transfer flavoprotein beta subunit